MGARITGAVVTALAVSGLLVGCSDPEPTPSRTLGESVGHYGRLNDAVKDVYVEHVPDAEWSQFGTGDLAGVAEPAGDQGVCLYATVPWQASAQAPLGTRTETWDAIVADLEPVLAGTGFDVVLDENDEDGGFEKLVASDNSGAMLSLDSDGGLSVWDARVLPADDGSCDLS